MRRAYLAVPFLLACAVILAAADIRTGHNRTTTPLHVTAIFFDGVDSGDFRQSCQVWEPERKQVTKCEAGLSAQLGSSAAYGVFGGYHVVAHSEKEWRTGAIEYATVKVTYGPTGGQPLVARLRKRPGGPWLVWYVA